ncbi:signal peptide peptidase SppA [uncultured Treponema sp.]|uniref:signal peptide peptidase SppA n=1 Tax=uncultured Treponema sp. TaxID=162155 RepID=UPI000E9700AF|nr:signal peptide peptidase SppA [uncultured Treponema sp.]HAZ97513.1 signal peptide peptidase SppA [Treponema sp.]
MKIKFSAKNYSKKGLAVFSCTIILAIAISIFSTANSALNNTKSTISEVSNSEAKIKDKLLGKKENKFPKNEYIAKLFIKGVISEANDSYNQEWILSTIKDLQEDMNNRGIVLIINSPGGGVYQADEVFLALEKYKKETERPVYAYFTSLAASGGYYVGCAADYIMANRNSLTGSIGVIAGQFTDLTGLMEKWGIKSTTIHAGRNKLMGNFNEPMTQEQREIMQSIADECYEQFTDIVAESRGLSKEEVYKLADGRIYTAAQAKEASLINSIGTLDELIETMQRKEFDFAEYETADFSYKKEDSIYNLIMGSAKEFKKASLGIPDAVMEVLEPQIEFPAYYYK